MRPTMEADASILILILPQSADGAPEHQIVWVRIEQDSKGKRRPGEKLLPWQASRLSGWLAGWRAGRQAGRPPSKQ